jgi:flagella basal body P-ring formation protein FlgA
LIAMDLHPPTREPHTFKAARAPLWLGLWALLGALPGLAQTQASGAATAALGAAPAATASRPAALPAVLPTTATPTAFAVASPSTTPPAVAPPIAPLPAASATADHEPLFAQARQWVMGQEQLPADQVRFAALDSRVRIAPCQEPLQFDYPFSSSRETVRVRCSGPTAWQLFLRLTQRPPTARAPSAPPPVAPAAVAMRTHTPVTLQPPMKTVVVAKRLLQRGTELDVSMLEEVQKPALGLDPLAIGSLKDVARAEAVRDLPAGTVLRSYDIRRSLMVRKGQSAMLTVGQNGSFQITVRVEAQQDGHLGEQIRLKNPESGRLISGVVTGPNSLKGL